MILTAKLYPPRIRRNGVSRIHLVEKLAAGMSGDLAESQPLRFARKLTLVAAPAGFGKTTLVGEWLQQSRWSTAWLALDEGDNDPTRFLTYFVAALQTIVPEIGIDVVSALQSQGADLKELTEALLIALLNDIASIAESLVFVLDDYHSLESRTIDQALIYIIDHLPPNLHLVLITRTDPTMPLSRWRARGEITEIRARDLRFTIEEASQFLQETMGLKLTAEDIATLETRTEGWIAGLQLAALSMQEADNLSEFVWAFSGSNRYILDYLVDEVLQKRPTGTRDFLLHTSILERMCAPLCDAILQSPQPTDSQTILEELEAANMFVVPLDSDRRWYRYHHLFADLLKDRLQRTEPELASTLHQRAAQWYLQHNFAAAAIRHTLTVNAFEQAAILIEDVAQGFTARGEQSSICMWIDAVPPELVRARPHLCLAHAWALSAVRDLSGIQTRLCDVEQILTGEQATSLTTTEIEDIEGQMAALGAVLSFWRLEDISGAIDACQQALTQLPQTNLYLRGKISLILGLLHRDNNDLVTATAMFSEAVVMNQAADNLFDAYQAREQLGNALTVQGKLQQAAELYRQSLHQATAEDGRQRPVACFALLGLGRVQYERYELGEALKHLEQALAMAQRYGLEYLVLNISIASALVRQSQHDWAAAQAMMDEAARIAQKWARKRPLERVALFQAGLWLAQGNVGAATHWAAGRGLGAGDPQNDWHEIAHLLLARLLFAQNQLDEALLLLQRLHAAAVSAGRFGHLIEIESLQALTLAAQGQRDAAIVTLTKSLTLAKAEGYVRCFVDAGPPMAQLLYEVAAQGIAPQFVGSLLTLFPESASAPSKQGADHSRIPAHGMGSTRDPSHQIVEPLSPRELEVLQLMAEGASNAEIAQRLVISVHTVKRHSMNLYGKLDVNNRTQAAAKARFLGILPL